MKAPALWCPRRTALALAVLLATAAIGQDEKSDKKEKKEEAKPAKVIILLPQADATLTIDGDATRQTGARRVFETPPLEPGKRFSYNVKAVWEPNNYTKITRTRKVYVQAGKDVEVDLNKEDPKQPDDIVVRYVPTPQAVVDAMLKLGKVGKDDIVYDLGCGDGRIPVTAVGKFKARRGVGVDLDPQRIKESNENARREGVTDKVEFRQADVLKIKDISDATVVTLYMGDDLNRQLRPILEKTLKPGSRIVSHRFKLGDWKPEKTETHDVSGVPYNIHLWTVKGRPEDKPKEKKKDKPKDEDKPRDEDKPKDKKKDEDKPKDKPKDEDKKKDEDRPKDKKKDEDKPEEKDKKKDEDRPKEKKKDDKKKDNDDPR